MAGSDAAADVVASVTEKSAALRAVRTGAQRETECGGDAMTRRLPATSQYFPFVPTPDVDRKRRVYLDKRLVPGLTRLNAALASTDAALTADRRVPTGCP